MIELASVEQEIDGPIVAIWAIVTDFSHPQRLAPTIDSAETTGAGVGAVRVVRSSRGLMIHEKLLACDPAGYLFRYAVLDSGDMPFANVTRYECTVRLHALSARRTRIGWHSEGTVEGPIDPVRAFLETLYRNANRNIADQIGPAV
jgi:carbon monoxide dehydrogenase subunit G